MLHKFFLNIGFFRPQNRYQKKAQTFLAINDNTNLQTIIGERTEIVRLVE